MTTKTKVRHGSEIIFGSAPPPEATEADAEEYDLGGETTAEDHTPSVLLTAMLEEPKRPTKKLKELGGKRERAAAEHSRPQELIFLGGGMAPKDKTPAGKVRGEKFTVRDDNSSIPEEWKDYL